MTVFWHEPPSPGGDGRGAWDICVLGGFVLPGVAKIEGAKAKRALDFKKAKGRDGKSLIDEGYSPEDFSIVLTLWEAEQLSALEQILPSLTPQRGQAPSAIDVSHPALDLLGIARAYVQEVGQIEGTGGGPRTLRITCQDFAPLRGTGGGASRVKDFSKTPKDADTEAQRGAFTQRALSVGGRFGSTLVSVIASGNQGASVKSLPASKRTVPPR